MIFEALDLLVQELKSYLKSVGITNTDLVELGNVSQLDNTGSGGGNGSSMLNKIIITLVNVEEEKVLRNKPNYRVINQQTEYANPPVHLNLYLLFSMTSTTYENALRYLSWIIKFFQHKNVFTPSNTPSANKPGTSGMNFRMILELYSPSFEESSFLWGTLGGKQLPSVIYKLRLLELEHELTEEVRGVVKQIDIND